MKKYDKEEYGFQIPHGFLEAVLFHILKELVVSVNFSFHIKLPDRQKNCGAADR